MKKIGYVLGVMGFIFLGLSVSLQDFSGSFLKNAPIVIVITLAGIGCLIYSVYIIYYREEERKKADYKAMIEGRKSSLLKQCRRIPALKKR